MGLFTRLLQKRDALTVIPNDEFRSTLTMGTTAAGVPINPNTALTISAVFSAIRVIAETLGSLPLFVYRKDQDGGKFKAPDHPLYKLLHDAPNPYMHRKKFIETAMGHVCGWGNFYALIDWDVRGVVTSLWPLRPDRMEIKKEKGEIIYLYRVDESNVIPLLPERVLHIAGMGFDGIQGYSVIKMARESLGVGKAAEEFGARFFGNDARPGIILKHPGELSKPAHERLINTFETQHGGLAKSHKVGILEEGMDLETVGIPPEDAQFLQTRKFQITEISRWFRVPPHKLYDLERATFSNIEHQSIEFTVDTIRPWLVEWELGIKLQLLTPTERETYFAEFLVDGLLRGDIQARYNAYAIGKQWGWLSTNDIRRLENMNPVENGNKFWMPLNMMAVGTSQDELAQRVKLLHDYPRLQPGDLVDVTLASRQAMGARSVQTRHRLQAAHLGIFNDVFTRILKRESNDIKGAINKIWKRRQAPADFDDWLRDFYSSHQDFVERQIMPVLSAYSGLIAESAANDVAVDDYQIRLDHFIQSYAESYAARHSARQLQRIYDLIENAKSTGDDPALILDESLDEWTDQAPRLASDESVRSGNAITKMIYQVGGVLQLRWVAFGDSCPYCTNLNGKVVGIQEWFLPAGSEFQPDGAEKPLTVPRSVGHAPAHGGCDCMITVG